METHLKDSKLVQIQILSITPVAHPTKTPGKTTPKLDIAFKNLSFNGKVEGKGLFSFGSQEGAFKTMQNAAPGEVYDIERVKEGEFQNWVSAKKSDGAASSPSSAPAQSVGTAAKSGGYTASPKSSYPTDEERAKVQVYIVRQSNITAALNRLSVGAKTPPSIDDILKDAKRFEDHVFGTSPEAAAAAEPFNVATAFDDLDDLPDLPQ